MLRVLSLALIALFTVTIVGCRAGAEVDATDDRNRDTRYERTTTVNPDGDRTIREERRIER